MLGREKAEILFSMINKSKSGSLSWLEFLQAMNIVRAKTKSDKLNLFAKLADLDGNGMLDYSEIYYLAEISLKTNYIFSSVNFDEN